MDKLNWKELEQIPIPEGLEERLSAKIDEWEKTLPLPISEQGSPKIDEWEKETLSPTLPRNGEGDHPESLSLRSKPNGSPHHGGNVRRTERLFSWLAIAASIVLVFGVGYYFLNNNEEKVNLAEQDTYSDPVIAQQEAEKALNLLAYNLNKGMGQLEKAKAISDSTETTLNKQLNILK